MDPQLVEAARRYHMRVPPEHRQRRAIVLTSPNERIVQNSRWTFQDSDPPRDYRELRDLGGGRDWYRCFESWRVPSRAEAYEHAAMVGYKVDPRALQARPVEAHRLAWQATCDLVREATRGPWCHGSMPEPAYLHRCIRTVIPYFIVPDPAGAAYLLDQLIIVEDPLDGKERMLALKISRDGASERELADQRAFDGSLAKLGFEVYRVSASWCLVDPLRAIVSMLRRAGVIPAELTLKGEHLDTIAGYVCASCRHEMIRHEGGAIELVRPDGYDDAQFAVHDFCVESAMDGVWFPAGERRPLVA